MIMDAMEVDHRRGHIWDTRAPQTTNTHQRYKRTYNGRYLGYHKSPTLANVV